jgi:hypothetical protein
VDIVFSLVAFFVLVASWFVLPSAPPATLAKKTATNESLAPAA